MTWFERVAARRAAGEKWDVILGDQGVAQIEQGIREAGQASAELAIPFLSHLSRHPSANIKEAVAVALGQFTYSDAIQVLLSLLADQREEVRRAATLSLGQLESPNIVPLLERMQRDRSQVVRQAASEAILRLLDSTDLHPGGVGGLFSRRAVERAVGVMYPDLLREEPDEELDPAARERRRHARVELQRYLNLLGGSEIEDIGEVVDGEDGSDDATRRGRRRTLGDGRGRRGRRVRSADGVDGEDELSRGRRRGTLGDERGRRGRGGRRDGRRVRRRSRQPDPRHLYGWLGAMIKDDAVEEGYVDYISCLEGYQYRFSVTISPSQILGADDLGRVPAAISGKPASLAVVLLPDDEDCLVVEDDPPVKLLHLPAEGASNEAHFTVRGLKQGESSFHVLVYHRGYLVIRGRTSPISIKAWPGRVEPFESGEDLRAAATVAGTVMDHSEDLGTIAERAQVDRFANLLIDEEEDRHGDEKLLFALFYQEGDPQDVSSYHFVPARVPAANVHIEFEILRERLLELIGMKSGLFGLHGAVFRDDVDMQISPQDGEEALRLLREAGRSLWLDLFADPALQPVRTQLIHLVSRSGDQGILQVVSDERFIPWQLLYVDDGEDVPKAERFWGMRFQIEHTRAHGVGLRSWRAAQGDEPMIAFINQTMPPPTLRKHEEIFSLKAYSEDDVIREFKRKPNGRPAFYFYCHAEFSSERRDECWVKLTDDTHRLTLLALEATSFDVEGKNLEFDRAPLVFLNACESGQVGSRFYGSFVSFFLNNKKAGGIIATETEMPVYFATDFAGKFWASMREEPKPVGQVLYELRKHYWEEYHNPLGLLYSLYANAELEVAV